MSCKVCGKSLDGVRPGYRSYRVCGDRCYRKWIKRLKAEIKTGDAWIGCKERYNG
jgi:hypothetical protein